MSTGKELQPGADLVAPVLSFGQKAAGVSFNPSNLQDVDTLKSIAAQFIDVCNILRSTAGRGEAGRYYSKAISYMEDAQMNAVKAVTWKD